MKKICSILSFLLFLSIQPALADSLNEGQLFTKDQSCQLHYLTHKNVTGWTFKIDEGACQNQLAQGHMTLTISNAFQKPIEQISGYFNQGYWVGNTPIQEKVLTRTADNKTQKLTFLIGKDDFLKALFIGQMSADAKQNNQYGPFVLCEPLKILIVSENRDLFKIQSNQISLFQKVQQYAAQLCPTQQTVMLFGSTKIDPTQADIFFYADLNVHHENARVLKTPEPTPPPRIEPQQPIEPVQPTPIPTFQNTPVEPEKNTQPIIASDSEQMVALVLLSKILQAPIEGAFVVQLDTINPDNTALLKPQNILFKGSPLKSGLQVVFGKMNATQPSPNESAIGVFQISRSVLCEPADCAAILEQENAL